VNVNRQQKGGPAPPSEKSRPDPLTSSPHSSYKPSFLDKESYTFNPSRRTACRTPHTRWRPSSRSSRLLRTKMGCRERSRMTCASEAVCSFKKPGSCSPCQFFLQHRDGLTAMASARVIAHGRPQSTMATGQVLFHRFYFVSSMLSFSVNVSCIPCRTRAESVAHCRTLPFRHCTSLRS
jgi:hypothetical protein